MLFNSLDFAVFLPIVFVLYWITPSQKIQEQNLILVLASYVFYGWWDWRFLFLIFLSTVIDYTVGLRLQTTTQAVKRKQLLWFSIICNLSILGFFKYFNFFQENFIAAFSLFGRELQGNTLHIILPVGISFYTFQTISYTIDIYRKKLEPTRDFIAFATFVSFFPQLVAGPIERATNLIPQFLHKRIFSYEKAVDGIGQIIWGLFKKMVVADNCAIIVNDIFKNYSEYGWGILILGAVLFAFQIYGDFSGYSDIAIGVAKLFGFYFAINFAYPYFSRDIAEFWRRWHISLSSWFKDYVYIPLGGSRGSTSMKIQNTFIIFLISGFWHGANWTFIVWGGLNALLFLPLLLTKRNRSHQEIVAKGRLIPPIHEVFNILLTFTATTFTWIFFRSDSLSHALQYIQGIFILQESTSFILLGKRIYVFIGALIVIEWLGREGKYPLERIAKEWPMYPKWVVFYSLSIFILLFGGKEQAFIYFQF